MIASAAIRNKLASSLLQPLQAAAVDSLPLTDSDISKQEVESLSRIFGLFLGVSLEEREASLQRLAIMRLMNGAEKYLQAKSNNSTGRQNSAADDSNHSTVKFGSDSENNSLPASPSNSDEQADFRTIKHLIRVLEKTQDKIHARYAEDMKTNNIERARTAVDVMDVQHDIKHLTTAFEDLNREHQLISSRVQDVSRKLDCEIDIVKTQLVGLEGKFDCMKGEVAGLDKKVDDLNDKVDGLETKVDCLKEEMNSKLDHVKEDVAHLNYKVANLDKKVNDLDKKVANLDKKVEDLDTKVDGLDTKVDGLDKKVDGLDKKVDGLDKKVDGLETKVDCLKAEMKMFVKSLENKIDSKFDALLENLGAPAQVARRGGRKGVAKAFGRSAVGRLRFAGR